MAKLKEVFICQNCGAASPKWQGQCTTCGEWNTLVAETVSANPRKAAVSAAKRADTSTSLAIEAVNESPRLSTGSGELDRVLGGGLVPGSVTLIGGDPGIGKSTLMLQAAAALNAGGPVLYATGEESLKQVALRARRLGLEAATARLITETCVEEVVGAATSLGALVLIVDSIQTMHSERVDAAPGAVSQLRESTAELVRFAKASGTAVLLVGHVTKEGQIAGPRVLEHMVDTVLYFESDTGSRYRVLRSVKNRFGAANEIGVFAMVEQGLREVTNPSAIFLSRHADPVPGSVITVLREGTRSLLIEVQVLADSSLGSNPRRVAVGIDGNRLTMLLAVAHRHGRALQPRERARIAVDHCVRRVGVGRRNPSRALRRRAIARSRQAWLQIGHRSGGERTAAPTRRHDGTRRDTLESGLAVSRDAVTAVARCGKRVTAEWARAGGCVPS